MPPPDSTRNKTCPGESEDYPHMGMLLTSRKEIGGESQGHERDDPMPDLRDEDFWFIGCFGDEYKRTDSLRWTYGRSLNKSINEL
jgi:hypothetical protein